APVVVEPDGGALEIVEEDDRGIALDSDVAQVLGSDPVVPFRERRKEGAGGGRILGEQKKCDQNPLQTHAYEGRGIPELSKESTNQVESAAGDTRSWSRAKVSRIPARRRTAPRRQKPDAIVIRPG